MAGSKMTIQECISVLEAWANPALQESYDNSGLIVGNRNSELRNILISLDCTEAVLEEALEKKCNFIISHHPFLFQSIKTIRLENATERIIWKAIKNDISLYAFHTNLDVISTGVNAKIAEKLALQNLKILSPKPKTIKKLSTFVPKESAEKVLQSLLAAGAGEIGNYTHCSFKTEGIGTFFPLENAHPTFGKRHTLEKVKEEKIEVQFPFYAQNQILNALKKNHPYEEIVYDILDLQNTNTEIGHGMIGTLEKELGEAEFLSYLKQKMGLNCIKHTNFRQKKVKKIAVCGGSGYFLLQDAIKSEADVFITSDIKYHNFFEVENKLLLCDIGHYESEIFTKELIYDYLSKKNTKFACFLSDTMTNPVHYFF